MTSIGYWPLLLIIIFPCVFACDMFREETLESEYYPYVFREVSKVSDSDRIITSDLNGDGYDEVITVHNRVEPDTPGHINIFSTDLQILSPQINISGDIGDVHTLDVTQNGEKEILITYVLRDTLWLKTIDKSGKAIFEFLLATGKSRLEGNDVFPWKPGVYGISLFDVNDDMKPELIYVVNTGYARMPRGIMIRSIPGGKLLHQKMIGAAINKFYFDDFDEDGKDEILVSTHVTNNGAEAGGFSDRNAYLLLFDLPSLDVISSRSFTEPGSKVYAYAYPGRILLTISNASADQPQARLEYIETGNWNNVIFTKSFIEPLGRAFPVDLDHDARPEIFFPHENNELWLLDSKFQEIKKQIMPYVSPSIMQDMDYDGTDEISVIFNDNTQGFLDTDMNIKAVFPRGRLEVVQRKGPHAKPHIFGRRDDRVILVSLENNPWYLWYRYNSPVLWILGTLFAIGLIIGVVINTRRTHLTRRIQTLTLDAVDQTIMVMNHKGLIRSANSSLNRLLDLPSSIRVEGKKVSEIFKGHPSLLNILNTIVQTRPLQQIVEITVGLQKIRASADAIHGDRSDSRLWLVRFEPAVHTDPVEARSWMLMAQRIAHDIKSPLTGLLLTAQQMQVKYQMVMPENAGTLDPFVDRITSRIEHLRRLTNTFMKFIDLEAPQRTSENFNSILMDVLTRMTPDIPSDIVVFSNLTDDLPDVQIDRELMQSVFENLISNALTAMANGGRLTVSTNRVDDLLDTDNPDRLPRDYITLEVQDTGYGIPQNALTRVFEPGYTTFENGTGLGLAFVEKIINNHDGRIEIESEVGLGTVVTLYLPFE